MPMELLLNTSILKYTHKIDEELSEIGFDIKFVFNLGHELLLIFYDTLSEDYTIEGEYLDIYRHDINKIVNYCNDYINELNLNEMDFLLDPENPDEYIVKKFTFIPNDTFYY